jgi:hypothetical protein
VAYKNDHWHEHEISYYQKQIIEDFYEYMQLIGGKVVLKNEFIR